MKYLRSNRLLFSIVFPLGLLLTFLAFSQSEILDVEKFLGSHKKYDREGPIDSKPAKNDKHRGAHIFGYLDSMNVKPFIENNIKWITLVSFGYQDDYHTSAIKYIWGRSDEVEINIARQDSIWSNQIETAHNSGFKVFFKPHLWLSDATEGKWRSDVYPSTEEGWKEWQADYRAFILFYAQIAEKNNVEMFCIGTELSRVAVEKPDYWRQLIQEVREVYSGELTYAANWYKEYEKIQFWDQLDYIGVQAYFPLTHHNFPSAEEISKGWKPHLSSLESVHKKFDKKVLFTEMGYKSIANSAVKPWEWIYHMDEEDKTYSTETQSNCYKAFFDTVWDQPWFAGVHIWQMRTGFEPRKDKIDLDFTPQGKPAEIVITEGFK